ncbi:hypothetical protein CsSME_00038907 [Camellia sinensis var. sinensis]
MPVSFSCDGCRERAANFDKFHRMCWVFIGLLATILQTMYQPFETHYPEVVAFISTITIYFLSLLAEFVQQTYGINLVIVNKLSSFLGVLAVFLLVLIIVPAIGWLVLGLWGCVLGIVARNSYFQIKSDFVNTVEEIRRVMNTLRNGNANEQQVNGMQGENLDAVEEIRRVNTLRNDNANEQQVNGMLVEFLNTVEEIRRRVMDTSRNGNANEQEVNGMQDELLEAVEEIRSAMNALRNGNANEQQVNGMHDELLKAVEEIRRAMRMAMQMSNEYGMQDENQHQHHELPV